MGISVIRGEKWHLGSCLGCDQNIFLGTTIYEISLDRIIVRVCDDCAREIIERLECQRLANKHDKERLK